MSTEDRDRDTRDEEQVVLPLDGVLDLHTFSPKDALSVTEEYLMACREAGVLELRIIHGKGVGVQREAVRRLLAALPWVCEFRDAEEEWGGWGATVATLSPLTEGDGAE